MRSPLLMLLPAILMAQRSALPPQEAFDRELKRNRLGTWLVLEDDDAAWGAALRAALEDEALVTLNLPSKVVTGGKKADALAQILRDRYSWAKGAHWALVDAKGSLLVEGTSQPTTKELKAAAERAGITSRSQELEAFLRQNPDHLEAQGALLKELVAVANRRTAQALGKPLEKAREKPEAGTSGTPEPPRQLDPEADLRIWAPVLQRLDQLFKGPWREAGIDPAIAISLSSAEHSPALVALLTRHRWDMEEALRHRPNGPEYWFLWLASSRKCGGWPLAPLLHSIQPLPGSGSGEWPPTMVLGEFVKDAKARKDWPAIRELLEARWEAMKADGFDWTGPGSWNLVLAPLVEALVTLGDVGAADLLLGEVAATSGWSGLPGQARDLANRLKRPDLAARWGALTPKGR